MMKIMIKVNILEVDVKYPKKLHDIPFLPKRMEIDKCKKLVCNLLNKKEIFSTYKVIKTSIKSWIKILKSS